jgi:hypothetical protein
VPRPETCNNPSTLITCKLWCRRYLLLAAGHYPGRTGAI